MREKPRKSLKYGRFMFRLRRRQLKHDVSRVVRLPSFRVPTGIAILFAILYFGFGHNFKFSLLGLNNQAAGIEILSIIATSLAAIFGIALAFIVLSIESTKGLFVWHTYKKIFAIEHMRELAALYISTILFSVISLLTFSTPSGDLDTTSTRLVTGAIYLFAVSLIVLIHYIRKILEASEGQDGIIELVESITPAHIGAMSKRSLPYGTSVSLKNNPIYITANVAKAAIRTENDLTARWLLEAVVETFDKSIQEQKKLDGQNHNRYGGRERDIINSYAYIIEEMAGAALKHKDISMFNGCMEALRYMSDICATQQLKWPAFNELFEMAHKLMIRAIEMGLGDGIRSSSMDYTSMPVQHWNDNTPKQDDIWEFNHDTKADEDHNNSLHWEHISSSFLYTIGRLEDAAIAAQNKEALSSILSDVRHLIFEIDKSKLGDQQKTHLLSHISWLIRSPIEKVIRRGIFEDDDVSWLIGHNDYRLMKNTIKGSDLQFFKDLTDLMLLAAKNNLLVPYTMNGLGAIGRGLVEAYNKDKDAKNALHYIIYVFDELRKVYTKSATKDEKSAACYLEAYNQLGSFKQWKGSKKIRNKELGQLLDRKLKLFTKRQGAEKITSNPTWSKLFNRQR